MSPQNRAVDEVSPIGLFLLLFPAPKVRWAEPVSAGLARQTKTVGASSRKRHMWSLPIGVQHPSS